MLSLTHEINHGASPPDTRMKPVSHGSIGMRRVGSGRINSFFKSRGSGRVKKFSKSRGSGRVRSRHLKKIAGRVGSRDPTRPDPTREI